MTHKMEEATSFDGTTPSLQYVVGDALNPREGNRLKIIAHVVNNVGGWGAGFVVPLGNKYPAAREDYRQWAKGNDQLSFLHEQGPFELGWNQYVVVESHVMVANMCAQNGYRSDAHPVAIDYAALELCLGALLWQANDLNASIHMPRIGCGLGGGKWEQVLDAMWDAFVCTSTMWPCPPVYVYDLP